MSNYSKEQVNFCKIGIKEENDEFYTRGYIATTHIDSVGDKLMKETLDKWADDLNSGDYTVNPVSIHHDRSDRNLAGIGTKANVEKLSDGEFGLFVDTHHNKTHPDFKDTKYQIDNKFLTHYSIEYETDEGNTTHRENVGGEWVRVIEPDTALKGYGLASPRTVVNDNASIEESGYKELIHVKGKMPASTSKGTHSGNKVPEGKKEDISKKEVKKMNEQKEDKKPAEAEEEKKVETPDEKEVVEEKKDEKPAEKEIKKVVTVEMKEFVKDEIKKRLSKAEPENKPLIEKKEKMENKKMEFKELTDYKEKVLGKEKGSISEQWASARNLHNSLIAKGATFSGEVKENPFEINGNQIELKAGSAVTTDTDYSGIQTTMMDALINYEQSPARYNDIYGPVIVNHLNDMTTTWNLLSKDNMSGMSAIRFKARTAANATAGHYAYGSTPGWDSNTTIKKFNVHFITSYVEIAVEFEAMELANSPGGIGDIYAKEIEFGTRDLMTVLNGSSGIFGTGDGTSESAPLGLDGGLIITTGTLYGRDVTATGFTTLAAAGVDAMGGAHITLTKMRSMVTACVTNGARREDLFFVTSHLQKDFIYGLIQDMQQIVPTSSRVGFTGVLELDGVPVFAEKDLDAASMTDDLFLLDPVSTRIGIKKAPTYQEFSLVALERRGIVWMMWNLFSEAPNHNYHITGLATS